MDKTGLDEVLHFWFAELKPRSWFVADTKLDEAIATRFGALFGMVAASGIEPSPVARHTLARIIVLDQFSRNMFRGSAAAFDHDDMALSLSKKGLAKGQDQKLPASEKAFFYMPFMHSENAKDQRRAVALFRAPGLENNYKFALQHKTIIDRFGRFAHRNRILGRRSTAAELAFLQQPGSRF